MAMLGLGPDKYSRMAYPAFLEAVLGAKEAVLVTKLEAGWALKGAGVIVAVDAKALFLCGGFSSHGGRLWVWQIEMQ